MKRLTLASGALCVVALTSGCHVDQWRQPRLNPLGESDFFPDRQASRPVVEGTVGYGRYHDNDAYHTGKDGKKPTKTIPVEAVKAFGGPKAMLDRGQERYNIYCLPCHGVMGDGNGFIALRGMGYWQKLPASFHQPRLVKETEGYLYSVLTDGKGAMYSYASRIQKPEDRWAVVAYVRTLQRAKGMTPTAAPAGEGLKAGNEEKKAELSPEGKEGAEH